MSRAAQLDQTLDLQPVLPDELRPLATERTTSAPQVRMRSLKDADASFLAAWRELEQSSGIRNPFASADYVLSAAEHLPGLAPPALLTVENRGVLIGLGVFESVAASRRLPLKHLRTWQTPHTYFDGLLLRDGYAGRALKEFWTFLTRGRRDWHAVEFPRFPVNEPVTQLFDASAHEAGVQCLRGTCWERASLNTRECDAGTLLQTISIKRAKSLRRGWRELEKHGPVRFEFEQDPDRILHCAQELIHLEGLGWKRDAGTSLGSQQAQCRFFRDMVARMNEQKNIFFSRILIGDRAIASVVNLKAGDAAYAFKLGWDPETERGCPGFHLKTQTLARAAAELNGIRQIDSCSQPGSFIEHVWPHRRGFCTRIYVTSPAGAVAAQFVNGLRWLKNQAVAASRHWSKPAPVEDHE